MIRHWRVFHGNWMFGFPGEFNILLDQTDIYSIWFLAAVVQMLTQIIKVMGMSCAFFKKRKTPSTCYLEVSSK